MKLAGDLRISLRVECKVRWDNCLLCWWHAIKKHKLHFVQSRAAALDALPIAYCVILHLLHSQSAEVTANCNLFVAFQHIIREMRAQLPESLASTSFRHTFFFVLLLLHCWWRKTNKIDERGKDLVAWKRRFFVRLLESSGAEAEKGVASGGRLPAAPHDPWAPPRGRLRLSFFPDTLQSWRTIAATHWNAPPPPPHPEHAPKISRKFFQQLIYLAKMLLSSCICTQSYVRESNYSASLLHHEQKQRPSHVPRVRLLNWPKRKEFESYFGDFNT
jgi:hypothetical protein